MNEDRTNNGMTLATALDSIYKRVDTYGLETFLEEGGEDCDYACNILEITPVQVALFAVILEKSGDDLAMTREIVGALGISKIYFLSLKQELDVLSAKRYISIRKRRTAQGYRVTQNVVQAVQNNTPVKQEKIDGLSSREIFIRMHSVFAEVANGSNSCEFALQEIYDLINHNRENSFVKKCFGLDIHCLDQDEQFLFFFMLHRAVSFGETEVDTMQLHNMPCGQTIDFDFLLHMINVGQSKLKTQGLVEFKCCDGIEDIDSLSIPESVRTDLLEGLSLTPKSTSVISIPQDELIGFSTIVEKPMFYNSEEDCQVKSLTRLLEQDNFTKVQERMREKGRRCGFCCLFYGPAGTGKTETVFQIARETGRDIFMVDMTKLRSKWVGESEKTVKELFNRYKQIVQESKVAPILLFNEADAIFGRRNEQAESSVDKLNNTIQNIILQEMETLDGILIATTNLTSNFDRAFERRFLYKILFKAPATEVKAKIWRSMISDLTEDEAASLAEEYSFTGGQIENITRKLDVDYILTGEGASFDKITAFCKEESIRKPSTTAHRKIGF